MANSHEWHRFVNPNEPLFDRFLEILRKFEPNTPLVHGLVSDPKNYRCYIARDKISGRGEAVGIACYLPKSNVLHIEDFILDPCIHGKRLANALYKSWREFICSEWPEAKCAGISTMIEVYLQNVEPWEKILLVEKVKVSQPAKFIREDTPIVVMARNLPCSPDDAYAEWQAYQEMFYGSLKNDETKKNLDGNIKNIIKYCSSLTGKPYVWWRGGIFTNKNIGPLWSCDDAPPDKKDIDTINCSGLINLGLRSIGLPLPVAKDGSKGGTLAYQEYYEAVSEKFDNKKVYPVGTLIGRRYNKKNNDQGHLAIIIENNHVLQSNDPDGVNTTYTLPESNEWHDGDYYTYIVMPQNWLQKEKPKAVKRLERIMSHICVLPISVESKSLVTSSGKQTGIVWHELFNWYNPGLIYSGQFPAEISQVKGVFIQAGEHFDKDTLSKSHSLIKVCLDDELHWIKPKCATIEQLHYVHDLEYINRIEAMNAKGGDAGPFTLFGSGGAEIAKLAVGGVIEAIDAVVNSVVKNAYCLIKPCGHHAEAKTGLGFCIFNNVAIGAKYAQKLGMKKIAILDIFDAQHGNGSQKTFYKDDTVLYISTHQKSLYPPGSGTIDQTGQGKGCGFTINIPLPPGTGEGGYYMTLNRIIIPAIQSFKPDIILVSCGYNTLALDPFSRMMVSSAWYVTATESLMKLADRHCDGRLVFCHEGGYSSAVMPFCVVNVIETLMDRKIKTVDPYRQEILGYGGHECTKEQSDVIDAVIDQHVLVAKTPLLSKNR